MCNDSGSICCALHRLSANSLRYALIFCKLATFCIDLVPFCDVMHGFSNNYALIFYQFAAFCIDFPSICCVHYALIFGALASKAIAGLCVRRDKLHRREIRACGPRAARADFEEKERSSSHFGTEFAELDLFSWNLAPQLGPAIGVPRHDSVASQLAESIRPD